MKWEAVGAIANVLAAVGVIATLIYLSVQIRQNNNQLRGAATIAVYDYQRGLTETLTEDQELYKIALRGNEDLDSLDPWENSASRSGRSKNQNWEMCHRLMKQGALDETLYRGKEACWLVLHSSPERRKWWQQYAGHVEQRVRRRRVRAIGPK
jgi:hypothetical protein